MKVINGAQAKTEFVKSIHKWLMRTLEQNGNEQYKNCFSLTESSIICDLPENYFNNFTIPPNTKIEMRFISKRT